MLGIFPLMLRNDYAQSNNSSNDEHSHIELRILSVDNHEFHKASLETVQQSIMFFYSIVTEDDRQNLSSPFFAGIRRKKST